MFTLTQSELDTATRTLVKRLKTGRRKLKIKIKTFAKGFRIVAVRPDGFCSTVVVNKDD